jgi:hypothetical protein
MLPVPVVVYEHAYSKFPIHLLYYVGCSLSVFVTTLAAFYHLDRREEQEQLRQYSTVDL